MLGFFGPPIQSTSGRRHGAGAILVLHNFVLHMILALACANWAAAKDKPLVAIVLYEGSSGPAWVQISDVALNGKTEVAVCTPGATLDNSAYRKLSKMRLLGVVSLERDAAGTMSLATGTGLYCIVPTNLKLEKGSYAPRDLAGMAVLQGKVISKSTNGSDVVPAEFKPGTKLQFVEAPDAELAEFLRAQRWQTVPLWRDYLKLYPAAAHVQDARQALATLITGSAEVEMAAFTKSVGAHAPAYDHLKNARTQTQEALQVLPSFVRAQKLDFAIRAQLQDVVTAGRNELKAFQTAVAEHTAGHEHINRAKSQVDDALRVDATFDQALRLQTEINQQLQSVEQAIAQAEAHASARRFDDAYAALQRYRSFAGELPRVAAVVDAAFSFHRDRGQESFQAGKLDDAIAEFRRALAYKEDAATAEALKKTEADLQTLRNKDAAQKAVEQSQTLAASKQFVEAYDLLDALPEGPRAFVTEPLAALTHDYVADALKRADALARVHIPIR